MGLSRPHLAIGEFGDPNGVPVLFCHGALASWRYRHPDDSIAERLGVRLITIARPGFGDSTRQPGRRVADWPATAAAAMDGLDIDRFAVVGHSGGGPHALACAALLGDRVTAVAAAGSLAPLTTEGRFAALGASRAVFEMARGDVADLEVALKPFADMVLTDPKGAAEAMFAGDRPSDALLELFVADGRDAMAQGPAGWADELHALATGWGFDVADVNVPVELWYGEDDPLTPVHGAALAEELGVPVTTHPGGHQAFFTVWHQALDSVREASHG